MESSDKLVLRLQGNCAPICKSLSRNEVNLRATIVAMKMFDVNTEIIPLLTGRYLRKLFVIPAEGGSPKQISSGKSDLDPTWSKDASALMYGVLPVPGDPEPPRSCAGSQNRRDPGRGSDGICCPRWSPNGRWVIALSAANRKLFLLDMSTQKRRQLADKIGIIGYMTWSRDSKYVGFDTSFTVDPAFFRVSPSDGQ
jgi:hypothetical protein